jgi:hypothetical protein
MFTPLTAAEGTPPLRASLTLHHPRTNDETTYGIEFDGYREYLAAQRDGVTVARAPISERAIRLWTLLAAKPGVWMAGDTLTPARHKSRHSLPSSELANAFFAVDAPLGVQNDSIRSAWRVVERLPFPLPGFTVDAAQQLVRRDADGTVFRPPLNVYLALAALQRAQGTLSRDEFSQWFWQVPSDAVDPRVQYVIRKAEAFCKNAEVPLLIQVTETSLTSRYYGDLLALRPHPQEFGGALEPLQTPPLEVQCPEFTERGHLVLERKCERSQLSLYVNDTMQRSVPLSSHAAEAWAAASRTFPEPVPRSAFGRDHPTQSSYRSRTTATELRHALRELRVQLALQTFTNNGTFRLTPTDFFVLPDAIIDPANCSVTLDGQVHELTPRMFLAVSAVCNNRTALDRDALVRHVYGTALSPDRYPQAYKLLQRDLEMFFDNVPTVLLIADDGGMQLQEGPGLLLSVDRERSCLVVRSGQTSRFGSALPPFTLRVWDEIRSADSDVGISMREIGRHLTVLPADQQTVVDASNQLQTALAEVESPVRIVKSEDGEHVRPVTLRPFWWKRVMSRPQACGVVVDGALQVLDPSEHLAIARMCNGGQSVGAADLVRHVYGEAFIPIPMRSRFRQLTARVANAIETHCLPLAMVEDDFGAALRSTEVDLPSAVTHNSDLSRRVDFGQRRRTHELSVGIVSSPDTKYLVAVQGIAVRGGCVADHDTQITWTMFVSRAGNTWSDDFPHNATVERLMRLDEQLAGRGTGTRWQLSPMGTAYRQMRMERISINGIVADPWHQVLRNEYGAAQLSGSAWMALAKVSEEHDGCSAAQLCACVWGTHAGEATFDDVLGLIDEVNGAFVILHDSRRIRMNNEHIDFEELRFSGDVNRKPVLDVDFETLL